MTQSLVSIIIVNYNGKEHLELCLKSLMKIIYQNFEVILVDNNSTDGSIETAKLINPNIKIIKLEKNFGFARPTNIGANQAKGDLLLFLNNDTTVEPMFIDELVDTIKSGSKVVMCQSYLLKPDNKIDSSGDFVDILGRAYSKREENPLSEKILSARAASMMIKKNIFFELGGFDERFFVSFEDVDLGWKANMFGYDVLLSPKSIVYHHGATTIKKINNEIQFHAAKNSIILRLTNFELYHSIKSLIVLSFVIVVRKTLNIKVIDDPEEGPPLPPFRTILSASFWVLKNIGYILEKRKEIKLKRILSTNELQKLGLIT